ncbi:16S rRNA (guanine(527)-N(7))-methyltransferase RsmG [Aureimonas fodinaquatilis]|uniref:Ribosomal RNA small subunit methyltransferase G n=1 Tax=Aureimonas fodinaquatilis TaxID=2565783 RepID=A0A5B0DR73_9HYPH|nr:16S rRNA (guanine(527)-N(7))-methyltransferase RsmG [Aureimonas fodinaquatilis]KAA0968241.1 16S rRNA (guanine(527)-N(7))-methyltransferase RsmG [Aureimonas fodinaquatilis]
MHSSSVVSQDANLKEDRAEVLARNIVSRETTDKLDRLVELTLQWQRSINLIAPSTVSHIWTRHIEDGLWLDHVAGRQSLWVDIGSGGGFPGLVLAITASANPGTKVAMIESNAKKCAFLRTVVRELALPAEVHCQRIESSAAVVEAATAVSARALASLPDLLNLVAPNLNKEAVCYFFKGRAHQQEIDEASANWRFSMVKHSSTVEVDSVILELRSVEA